MQVVCDIEANSLTKPTKIWCIVCKDIATGKVEIFRELVTNELERQRFTTFASGVTRWIGHNFLGYDWPVISSLLGIVDEDITAKTIDTLIVSKLVNYSRSGHSVEDYGLQFGLEKIKFNTFTHWSQEMEDYCVRDVEITHRIYNLYLRIIDDAAWADSILLEHRFQLVCNDLHDNGFSFNVPKANRLLAFVEGELSKLDVQIQEAFPPREVLIREFTPKETKYGTINRTSVPRSLHSNIHLYSVGEVYRHTKLEPFNPSSHKQILDVLNEAGWKPEEKTKSHIETERELNRLKYSRNEESKVDLKELSAKLEILKISGWKVNETNLLTLPETAPPPARFLAKRIMLEARRRSLVEWLGLVHEDGRIHGKFYGIGAWTHRMAHQQPNTANIPREFKEDGSLKLLGKEMRELWVAPKNRLLVGVDAEGIQLRIFAHYIDDPEFTRALMEGRKDDKTDPHSLNQRIIGSICKSRQAAKRFIYALLLGGGVGKLAQILETSESETKKALDRLYERYLGFKLLRKTAIPQDARRGFFRGLDGRLVPIPGASQRDREHLCMSGYLQCGEALAMKRAALIIDAKLAKEKELKKWFFVNLVHDELQSETRNSVDFAIQVAKIKADAIREAGEYYKLKCPLAGSYWNDDTKRNTIGTNWYATH